MSEVKVVVTKVPEFDFECPFYNRRDDQCKLSVFDHEECRLHLGLPCNKLVPAKYCP